MHSEILLLFFYNTIAFLPWVNTWRHCRSKTGRTQSPSMNSMRTTLTATMSASRSTGNVCERCGYDASAQAEYLCVFLMHTFYSLSSLMPISNDIFRLNICCRGHVCIIVNVATKWGATDRNYRQLVALYEKHAEKNGLRILAFPCNQFGNQEPGTNEEIKKFAQGKPDFSNCPSKQLPILFFFLTHDVLRKWARQESLQNESETEISDSSPFVESCRTWCSH